MKLRRYHGFSRGIFIPPSQKKWGRVRDEGDKITMAIKHIINKTAIDGTKEVRINTDKFNSSPELTFENYDKVLLNTP